MNPTNPASLHRDVLRLALPGLGEQFLVLLVSVFGVYLSGQISVSATTAIGIGVYVNWLATLALSLVSTGTMALVARYSGAKRPDLVNTVLENAIPVAVISGLVISVLLFLLAPLFTWLMNATGETETFTLHYLRIDATSLVFLAVLLASSAALRGAGDMRTPMILLTGMNVLNVILAATFVFGFNLGVDGIAWGAWLSRLAGMIVILFAFRTGRSGFTPKWGRARLNSSTIRELLTVGLPASGDGILTWTGHFLFLMVIRGLGNTSDEADVYFSAHQIGIEVESLTYLPATAWGYASASLIGFALGAGDKQRARRIAWVAAGQCCLVSTVAALSYFFFALPFYQLMHKDPRVWEVGVPALRFLAFFQIPLTMLIVMTRSLQGAGDTRVPLLFTILGTIAIRPPVAWLCGVYWGGNLIGAWIGMCVDVTVRSILMTWRYLRGNWGGSLNV